MTSPVEDEFTELVDADIPRVDLVDKAANGTTFLIAKQAAGSQAGLLKPEFVRSLIGKSAPADHTTETVTMSGSPGAIAKLIHEAAVRQAAADAVTKAELSQAKQNDLPDSDFAYIEAGGHKDDDGRTVPRSLRHFPINDEAHVRNALARAPQSPFGDKAMPKIRAAAKKFGIEVSKMIGGDMDEGQDGLDPTVVLASPEDVTEAPGDPNDPGSPAWEAIDAATARKWTSILARARGALEVMADREMLEAATADPSDAEDAYDLQDAACAIDYAISLLAPFAVDEQAEADCGTDMAAVGKALAGYDTSNLDTIEAVAAVRKAGRVLSANNEEAIRRAVDSLQHVLASLPAAPIEKTSGPEVAKTANEEPNMPAAEPSSDVTAESGQEPAMGTKEPEPVGKADGEKTPMVVVYDQKGRLIGIVDPSDVTPVANAEADADDMDATHSGDASADSSTDNTQATDLAPQPAGEAGTPADAPVPDEDDDTVTKSTTTPQDTNLSETLKSSLLGLLKNALDEHGASNTAQIATTGDAVLELASMVETLKQQVTKLEEQPAEPKVFTQGAGPRPLQQHLRGHDQGATPEVDFAKAAELKKQLYRGGHANDQQDAFLGLQEMAIAQLSAMRAQQK